MLPAPHVRARRVAVALVLAAARRRVQLWHWLIRLAERRQDRAYDALVALELRWLP